MASSEYAPNAFASGAGVPGEEGGSARLPPQSLPAISKESDSERRSRFNALLVSLCVDFINRPVERLAAGLSDALRQIGEFTGVDRCFLYQLSDDGAFADLTHSWTAEGVPSDKPQMQRLPTEGFRWEMGQIVQQGQLHVPSVEELPEEAAGLRSKYEELGVVSAVNVPLIVDGRLVGVLGFSNVHEHKSWTDHDVALMKVLAEVLVSVLQRSRADEALRESEARFREVVSDQTELIVRSDAEGKLVFANEAMCRYVQKSQAEVLGMSVLDLVHPEDLAEVKRVRSRLSIDQPVMTFEHRTVRPDGSVGWHQWVKRARFDADGNVLGYQTVGRDITRLKQANNELEYRRGFESLILALGLRFINLPPELFNSEFNDALKQVTEFTGVSRTFVYLFDRERNEAHIHDEWASPGLPPMPEVFHTLRLADFPWAAEPLNNGDPIHVPTVDALPPEAATFGAQLKALGLKSYINVPMLVGGQIFGHLGCTCVDQPKKWSDDEIALLRLIGEMLINALKRRETEEALAVSERRLRLTVESIEDGMFDWNIIEGHAYISDHLKRSVGLPDNQLAWSFNEWADRVHMDDRSHVMANLNAHLEGRSPLYDAEYRFRTENRGYRWMHSRGRVVEFSPEGDPQRMVGVQRDITQQINEREERRRREEQMTHLGRVAAMGETVAGIAHEVNQPLHAASTFCAAAREAIRSVSPESQERAMELCDRAADQVHRAGEIIHRLREFTKPRPTERVPVDLNGLVRQTVEFTDQIGKSRDILLALDLDPSGPSVLADRVQVQQVLVNLIQNACESLQEAGDSAPALVISTRAVEGHVEVVVRDNASTPAPEQPEALFNAFYTTKAEGMGIGLALCRTILAALGGEIRAEANPDCGMAFLFTLPLEEKLA